MPIELTPLPPTSQEASPNTSMPGEPAEEEAPTPVTPGEVALSLLEEGVSDGTLSPLGYAYGFFNHGAADEDGLVTRIISTEHGELSGLLDDDHPQYGPIENGFEDSASPTARSLTTLSFDNGTRTLTLSTSAPYTVVTGRVRLQIDSSISAQITDVEGFHWFFMRADKTLLVVPGYSLGTEVVTYALVAGVYWDATNKQVIRFQDERHGLTMDGATHAYLHRTRGAQYDSGLALGDMTVDGDGSLEDHAQLSVAGGVIRDEDLPHTITGNAPQTLAPVAEIPVFYREGAEGLWRQYPATQFPIATTGTGRAAWNEWTGATWQVTETTNGRYLLCHIFATGDITEPMISIMGQNQYQNALSARDGAYTELGDLQFGPLAQLTPEIVPIATVIVQTSAGYANSVKSRFVSTDEGDDYIDWRSTPPVGSSASGGVTDHGDLTGLLDNDHPQYGPIISGLDDRPDPSARATTSIAFDNPTRTFSISIDPPAVAYNVTSGNVRREILTTQSVQIPDLEGFHWIYFDAAGVLTSTQSLAAADTPENASVGGVYWDTTNNLAIRLHDNRHGNTMDYATHEFLRLTHGAVITSGLGLLNITADGSGDLDAHATFGVDAGTLQEECIQHNIPNGIPQVLDPVAQVPIFYRSGVAGVWRRAPVTSFAIATTGTGRAAWNEWTGTMWQLTEAANNKFVLVHIFGSGDALAPIFSIMSQAEHATIGEARDAAGTEILSFKLGILDAYAYAIAPIATLIFQTADAYANAVKSRIRTTGTGDDYIDWRQTSPLASSGSAEPAFSPVDASARDSVNAALIYIGRSSADIPDTSLAEWQIYRYDSEAALFTPLYADGNMDYDNIWDNREALSYS